MRTFLKARQITQRHAAQQAGITPAAVTKWIQGSKPGAQELYKFASANGVSVESFLSPEEKHLTHSSLKGNNEGVKSEIGELIAEVKMKSAKRGAKAELARTLNVKPARISEWLSGKKEPGGDMTLRLQKWVKQKECQK